MEFLQTEKEKQKMMNAYFRAALYELAAEVCCKGVLFMTKDVFYSAFGCAFPFAVHPLPPLPQISNLLTKRSVVPPSLVLTIAYNTI